MDHSSNLNAQRAAVEVPSSDCSAVAPDRVNSIEFWWLPFVGVMAIVFCAPFFHLAFFVPDEGVFLHGAERLLQGKMIYWDFFEFLVPGGFLITAGWFAITGVSFASARCLAILTIAAVACFTYLACRRATKHAASSALVAVGWVIMSQGIWTQIGHHWFTTLFSMIALWATLTSIGRSRRARRWAIAAGLAAGAAAMATQTRGALVMLAAATTFVKPRGPWPVAAAYVCSSVVVPLAVLGYIVGGGALGAAFDSVILFPARHYADFQGVPYGEHADVRNFPLVVLFPVTAVLAALTYIRERWVGYHDPLLRSCAAFALAGFFGFLPRMDAAHIAFAAPLACPLFVYCIRRLTENWRLSYRFAMAIVTVSLCLPSLYGFILLYQAPRHLETVSTPRGLVTVPPELRGLERLMARMEEAPREDGYFFYPFNPELAFLAARQHVARYDVFIPPGYASPFQYQDACTSIVQRATWVVIDRRMTEPAWLKWLFPALREIPLAAIRFERVLESGFAFVARDGSFEVRRRLGNVNEGICVGIAD